jgi:hypothetical protein
MANQPHCEHQGCRCEVPQDRATKGDAYCSDYCKSHDKPGHTQHQCTCGHPGCK